MSKDLKRVLSEKYNDLTSLRAAVSLIPMVGGALDILVSGHGNKLQQERFESFLKELDARLQAVELKHEVKFSNEFYDLVTMAVEGSIKTRHKDKHRLFAMVLANQVVTDGNWEEAETATRLLNDLDTTHIRVLNFAENLPPCGSPFDHLKVFTIDGQLAEFTQPGPTELQAHFPEMPSEVLKMVCSELVARGLLEDEGVGRWDTGAMEYFKISNLGLWFLRWLRS